MSDRVSFPCPECDAALQAPVRKAGRSANCPACGEKVRVPPLIPEEQGPLLVLDDAPQPRTLGYR